MRSRWIVLDTEAEFIGKQIHCWILVFGPIVSGAFIRGAEAELDSFTYKQYRLDIFT